MTKRIIYFDITELSKSQLKDIGIYKISNTITKDFYIGSASRSFNERFKEHSRYYEQWKNKELHRSHHPILWNAYNKYNIRNFKIEILKEMNGCTKEEILKEEENFILTLKPVYNICQHPTVGGSPNLGKKLTKEWKEAIAKKSKEYKHSKETLEKVSTNNKNNANKIEMINNDEILKFESFKEASNYFKVSPSSIQNALKRTGKFRGYEIKVLSKQAHKIKIFKDSEELIFNSFNECDKYFNMWRGYTSTLVNKKSKNLFIEKYKFELIWRYSQALYESLKIKDGITARMPRSDASKYYEICSRWEKVTKLVLEHAQYKKMVIRDVSSYIAVYENGDTKLKGCFEIFQELNKNPSMRIVPIALKEYYLNGTPIQQTIRNHKDIYDFCLMTKANSGWKTVLTYIDKEDNCKTKKKDLSKITRYYISGGSTSLCKENVEDHRITGVNVGYSVKIFNQYEEKTMSKYNINYTFYIKECYKIINSVDNGQLNYLKEDGKRNEKLFI